MGYWGDTATGLRRLPSDPAEQPSDIAGGPDQIVLESDLGLTAIPGLAYAIASHQFALGVLDAVALVLERLGLLFLAAGLQQRVELADDEGAMALAGADALRAQWAISSNPFNGHGTTGNFLCAIGGGE